MKRRNLPLPALVLMVVCLVCAASACRKKARSGASQPGATADSAQEATPGADGKSPGAPTASDPNSIAKAIPTNAPPPLKVDPKTGRIPVVSDTTVLRTKVNVEGK